MNTKYHVTKILLESDKFKDIISDAREKGKELTTKLSKDAISKMEVLLKNDLEKNGADVISLSIKLGKFRGHHFITSAKIITKISEDRSDKLLSYLQTQYSPKFKLKSYENGEANYNIR